ncbi:MAG: D-2-hydroxyacid dehydrogenase [Candidatus Pacebacteria bacterium]|nr:D-2-hydroxyacid dehydrogenase [Candidatus Paceibacterota bacterium]
MEKIVFLDRESLGVEFQKPQFKHDYVEYAETWGEAETITRLKDATIAVINKVPMTANVLSQLPHLKLIAVAATGTDVVDKAAAKSKGVLVTNVKGYAHTTVPEHCLALIFALSRNLLPYAQTRHNNHWSKVRQFCYFDYPIRDLKNTTLGIVGYGVIGRGLAERARGLGMKILATDYQKFDGWVSQDDVLTQSDIISLHCPLTPETKHLINAQSIAKMKKGAMIINTARGPLIDEAALLAALRSGHLGGAGIDVISVEPPPADHPMLTADLPNLIVTPHVAWASFEAMTELSGIVTANIEAFVAGKPQNLVE